MSNWIPASCEGCGAVLPPGKSGLCQLCASGLVQAVPRSGSVVRTADPVQLLGEPGADSGMRCGHCRSSLTYRDVGHQRCPVCGGSLGLESMLTPLGVPMTPAGRAVYGFEHVPLPPEEETPAAPDEGLWDPDVPVW